MDTFKIIGALPMSERIAVLKKEMLDEPRYATIEQARIITKSYRQTEGQPRCIQRAKALKAALEEMTGSWATERPAFGAAWYSRRPARLG